MPDLVFYAWQSDSPSATNRNFIRKAIDLAVEAVNAGLNVEDALRPDQDTQGVPGDVSIADVIFEKIERCRIFVADVTTITPPGAARTAPNPNVLIEYGRASVRPGSDSVITVFNEAYGNWLTDRPFDMRHRRPPVTYHLPEVHSGEQRKEARRKLVGGLKDAIGLMLASAAPPAPLASIEQFDVFQKEYASTLPREPVRSRIIGFWAGLIPVGGGLRVEKPWEKEALVHRFRQLPVALGNTRLQFETIDGPTSDGSFELRPVQRGVSGTNRRRFESHYRGQYAEDVVSVRVLETGRIGLAARTTELAPQPLLNVRWIMADAANILAVLDRVRRAANRPVMPYAMVIELRYDEQISPTEVAPVVSGEWRLCDISDETGRVGPIVSSEPKRYGPISVGSIETFPNVLYTIYTDIVTGAGRVPKSDLRFEPRLGDVT
jgi:hypothetical protein